MLFQPFLEDHLGYMKETVLGETNLLVHGGKIPVSSQFHTSHVESPIHQVHLSFIPLSPSCHASTSACQLDSWWTPHGDESQIQYLHPSGNIWNLHALCVASFIARVAPLSFRNNEAVQRNDSCDEFWSATGRRVRVWCEWKVISGILCVFHPQTIHQTTQHRAEEHLQTPLWMPCPTDLCHKACHQEEVE